MEHQPKLFISNNALHYAIEQHLPPINIKCEPKVINQKHGTILIKELFSAIEKEFRKLNAKYVKPLGFDYWFIDRDGNLQCYTREIELFVFLCDPQNYPIKLSNSTTINPNPPKRLPPQRMIILKYVPRDIHIKDIKNETFSKYKSVFNIEEMRGTIDGKNRHVRLDLTDHEDYMHDECAVPIVHRFHSPSNDNDLFWYSFDVGSVHVACYSMKHDFLPSSSQYAWIKHDLSSVDRNRTPW
ncbi:unnamed protein product, partial [Rotaria sp. Silwood2]